jgi:cysteine synthase
MTAVAKRVAEGADVEPLVCASPGNAGQSMAAYAGRADLRSYAFVPSRCAFSNKSMTNVHGGEMRVVGGRFPDAAAAVDEQLETEYTDLGEFVTPYRHEGAKTIAFELVADLGAAPDVVVVPTGSGEVIAGVHKGFVELNRIGAIEDAPRVVAAQAAGCAPIAAAVERGPVVDDSVVVAERAPVAEVVETRPGVGFRTGEEEVTRLGCGFLPVGTGDAAGDVDYALAVGPHRELCPVVEAGVEVGVEQLPDALGTGRVERTGWHVDCNPGIRKIRWGRSGLTRTPRAL